MLLIALMLFLVLANWIGSGLLAFLPLDIFDSLGHLLGWIVLGGLLVLGSWFFGE